LHKRKQSVNGKKEVLQGWLLGAINAPVMTGDRNKELQEQVTGFAPEAKWQDLTRNNNPVQEPTRNSNLVGPTILTGEKECTKYNFDEIFDRPPFTAMSKVVELNVKGKPIKDKHSRVMLHEKIREKGRANMKWLEENRLTKNSMPAAWVNALL